MSTDDISGGEIPGLTREQKDLLRVKLAYLEELEVKLEAGEIKGEEADQELSATMVEIEGIMEQGRKQAELQKQLELLEAELAATQAEKSEVEELNNLLNSPGGSVNSSVNPIESIDNASSEIANNNADEIDVASLPRLDHGVKPVVSVQDKAESVKGQALERVSSEQDKPLGKASSLGESKAENKVNNEPRKLRSKSKHPKKPLTKKSLDQKISKTINNGPQPKSNSKPKLKVPTNVPRSQQKKKFPVGIVVVLLILGVG